MVYSDTDLKNGLLQRIEDYTQLGDGVITGDSTLAKKMTSNVNETLYELTTDIMLLQDDFDWDDPYKVDFPIATTPTTLARDYQFDNLSFLKIKRVDVAYDGVNYVRATPFDSASYAGSPDDDTNFDASAPMYDPKSFGFWLYPKAQDTNGLIRVEFGRTFDEFLYDDTDKEPPIDRNFHDLIAIGASLKWAGIPDKQYQKLLPLYEMGKRKMVQHYSDRNEDSFLTFRDNITTNYK
jgi:hypothetical protein